MGKLELPLNQKKSARKHGQERAGISLNVRKTALVVTVVCLVALSDSSAFTEIPGMYPGPHDTFPGLPDPFPGEI